MRKSASLTTPSKVSCRKPHGPGSRHLRKTQEKKRGAGINSLSAHNLGLLPVLPVFSLRLEAKQQIKMISVKFVQELLCFDFAVLFGFAWIEARDIDRILARKGMYHKMILFF